VEDDVTSPTYFRVSPRFWADPAMRGDDVRLLALYLLTCPARRTEGLFRLPRAYAAADLGWPSHRLDDAWDQLVRVGFLEEDEETQLVLLPAALRYQPAENPNQTKAVLAHLRDLPPSPLVGRLHEAARELCPRLARAMDEELVSPTLMDALEELTRAPEPVAEAEEPDAEPAVDELAEPFTAFWELYPKRNGKKVGKRLAADKWRKLTGPKRQAAMAAVVHYRDACDAGLTLAKDAHRWLAACAWEDWSTPAEAAPRRGGFVPQELVNRPGTGKVVL
jgi:hypothetical protein